MVDAVDVDESVRAARCLSLRARLASLKQQLVDNAVDLQRAAVYQGASPLGVTGLHVELEGGLLEVGAQPDLGGGGGGGCGSGCGRHLEVGGCGRS